MKTILIFLFFAGLASAQVKHEVCYRKTDTSVVPNTVSERCVILSVGLRQALLNWSDTQHNADGAPLYNGISSIVFSVLQNSLFVPALDQFPTAAMIKAQAAAERSLAAAQAEAALRAEKESVLPNIPTTEP